MDKQIKKSGWAAAGLIAAFVLWTAVVLRVDVQAIGPLGFAVGLAGFNQFIHERTGVHMVLYTLTDWLSLIPIALAMGFALLGLAQWIQRKRLDKVDRSLLILGGFYAVVIAVYVLFEFWVVNFRPVMIEGRLEASYPSSTTMLVLTVMPTAALQLHSRIRRVPLRRFLLLLITAFSLLMLLGRFVSGVHWASDIIGGTLLSAGLVLMYSFMCALLNAKT